MNDEKSAVAVQRRERLLLITINRPEQRNAINAAVAGGILDALDQLDADDGLSVGILTGAGKGFCAGMDLKAFVPGNVPHAGARGFAGIAQRASVKPLIAAVEGFAAPAGSKSRSPATSSSHPRARSWVFPRSSARSSRRVAACCGCPVSCPATSRTRWH